MTDKPRNTLQALAQAMRNRDIEQGHTSPDSPDGGRYDVLAREAVETLHKRGELSSWTLKSILEGKA
jgi:hypothetical protein